MCFLDEQGRSERAAPTDCTHTHRTEYNTKRVAVLYFRDVDPSSSARRTHPWCRVVLSDSAILPTDDRQSDRWLVPEQRQHNNNNNNNNNSNNTDQVRRYHQPHLHCNRSFDHYLACSVWRHSVYFLINFYVVKMTLINYFLATPDYAILRKHDCGTVE